MAVYTKTGSFGWAGGGKDGAIVDMWAASRFAVPPAMNAAPPAGVADAGPVTTDVSFGNPGAYVITGIPTLQDYYVRIQYGGVTYWGFCAEGTLGGQSSPAGNFVSTGGGSVITIPVGATQPGLTIKWDPLAAATENSGLLLLDPFNAPICALGANTGVLAFGALVGASTQILGEYLSIDGTTNPAALRLPNTAQNHVWFGPGPPSTQWVKGTTQVNDIWYNIVNGQWYTCIATGSGIGPGTWVFDGAVTVTPMVISSNAYRLALTDANTSQQCSNASAATVTVPYNVGVGGVPFPVGTLITLTQSGAGKIQLAQGAGVTINSSVSGGFVNGSTGTRVPWSTMGLEYWGSDTWILTGDVA